MHKLLIAGIAAMGALLAADGGEASAEGSRWGRDYFPNLPVVTQDGASLRFYDDLIKSKIVVISFIYTRCPDICPLTTARLALVAERLGDAVGRDVFFYSLSVDPGNDTPAELKEFAQAFGAGPGWLFLTGKPEDMQAIRYKLGDRSRKLNEHRQEIVLGNDVTGEWARNSAMGELESLLMDIRAMDPRWRNATVATGSGVGSDTVHQLSPEPGQALFKRICAPCHTIGVGDRVGPDLRGVTDRRENAWLARFIRDPHRMRAERDPIAVDLAARYPGARMPRLGLSQNDAVDLIAYLAAQTARLSPAESPSAAQHHHDTHRH